MVVSNQQETLLTKLATLVRQAEARGVDVVASFSHFDSTGDGQLNRAEFQRGLKSLGFSFNMQELIALMDQLDSDGDGTISSAEFARLAGAGVKAKPDVLLADHALLRLRQLIIEASSSLDFREIFEAFDADHSGYIDKAELSKASRALGCELQPASVDAVFTTHGDARGRLSLESFLSLVSPPPDANMTAEIEARTEAVVTKLRRFVHSAVEERGVDLATVFGHFDNDGDGSISRREFVAGLRSLGFNEVTEAEIRLLLRRFEHAPGSGLDARGFLAMLQVWNNDRAEHARRHAERQRARDFMDAGRTRVGGQRGLRMVASDRGGRSISSTETLGEATDDTVLAALRRAFATLSNGSGVHYGERRVLLSELLDWIRRDPDSSGVAASSRARATLTALETHAHGGRSVTWTELRLLCSATTQGDDLNYDPMRVTIARLETCFSPNILQAVRAAVRGRSEARCTMPALLESMARDHRCAHMLRLNGAKMPLASCEAARRSLGYAGLLAELCGPLWGAYLETRAFRGEAAYIRKVADRSTNIM